MAERHDLPTTSGENEMENIRAPLRRHGSGSHEHSSGATVSDLRCHPSNTDLQGLRGRGRV